MTTRDELILKLAKILYENDGGVSNQAYKVSYWRERPDFDDLTESENMVYTKMAQATVNMMEDMGVISNRHIAK